MFFCLVIDDIDVSELLGHAPANVARDNEADRKAMVGLELLTVGLIGNEDVVRDVDGAGQWHGGAVVHELD